MKSNKGSRFQLFKRKNLCIPYGIFLVLFIIVPILIIVFYAFTDDNGRILRSQAEIIPSKSMWQRYIP